TALAGLTGVALADGAQSLTHQTAAMFGAMESARFVPALLFAGALLWFACSNAPFRASLRDVAGGVVIGVLIPASWLATGWLGADDFDPAPLVALTFVAPIGATIQYAMIATGTAVSFGIATVCGVFLGALGAAVLS